MTPATSSFETGRPTRRARRLPLLLTLLGHKVPDFQKLQRELEEFTRQHPHGKIESVGQRADQLRGSVKVYRCTFCKAEKEIFLPD